MTTIKKVALVAAGVLCVLLFSAGAISAGPGKASSEAAYKAATDTDPHLPLTPVQQRALGLKKQLAADAVSGKITPAEARARSHEIALEINAMVVTGTETESSEPVPGG